MQSLNLLIFSLLGLQEKEELHLPKTNKQKQPWRAKKKKKKKKKNPASFFNQKQKNKQNKTKNKTNKKQNDPPRKKNLKLLTFS